MMPIDSRNRDPEPPVILDPLLVLLSSRAVTAAKDKPVWEVKRKDWIPVP